MNNLQDKPALFLLFMASLRAAPHFLDVSVICNASAMWWPGWLSKCSPITQHRRLRIPRSPPELHPPLPRPGAPSQQLCSWAEEKLHLGFSQFNFSFGNCFQFCNQQSLTFCYSKPRDLEVVAYLAAKVCSGDTSTINSMRRRFPKKLVSDTDREAFTATGNRMMPEGDYFPASWEPCFGG